jgi:hypothetical protein
MTFDTALVDVVLREAGNTAWIYVPANTPLDNLVPGSLISFPDVPSLADYEFKVFDIRTDIASATTMFGDTLENVTQIKLTGDMSIVNWTSTYEPFGETTISYSNIPSTDMSNTCQAWFGQDPEMCWYLG